MRKAELLEEKQTSKGHADQGIELEKQKSYLESVIGELEEKNRRMQDILND